MALCSQPALVRSICLHRANSHTRLPVWVGGIANGIAICLDAPLICTNKSIMGPSDCGPRRTVFLRDLSLPRSNLVVCLRLLPLVADGRKVWNDADVNVDYTASPLSFSRGTTYSGRLPNRNVYSTPHGE